MNAIRILIDGHQARYNPAPDQRREGESDTDFLYRIAGEVGGEVVDENDIAYDAPPMSLPTISKAQALLWLYSRGKRTNDIQALISSLPTTEMRDKAQIEWDYRREWETTNPLLQALWPALGLTETLEEAFREAALL